MNSAPVPDNWPELLRQPSAGEHFVQLYQDDAFLCDAVAEYLGAGLARGEAAILIVTSAHRAALERSLAANGVHPRRACRRRQLLTLDAERCLACFYPGGSADWQAFRELFGGAIGELRLRYPRVRAFGEMVDVLWQRGEPEGALAIEEFWNELARLQAFSLLCAYRIDNLDAAAYTAPLECMCRLHSQVIPARNYGAFDDAVYRASVEVLDEPLARVLLSIAANDRATGMPNGQATLLWLKRNMPLTAAKVLEELRRPANPSAASAA